MVLVAHSSLLIRADLLIKATKVDGVYDKDPLMFNDAKKFKTITYKEVIARDINVMDKTAISLCMEENIPIYVFNILEPGNLKKVIQGKDIGTLVK